eukprot:SAG31_NODE_3722_length_3949_cov_7.490130_3_plen_112_part_00
MSLGGLLIMIDISPLKWISGAYQVAFGVMIVGAEFNIERILKYMAFLRGFLGKGSQLVHASVQTQTIRFLSGIVLPSGAFFLYLGIPQVEAGLAAGECTGTMTRIPRSVFP